MSDELRTCNRCNETKTLTEFVSAGKEGRRKICKVCRMAKLRERYEALVAAAGEGQRGCKHCYRVLPVAMFGAKSLSCLPCNETSNATKRHSWRRRHG
jgi:hypothetical protein